MVCECLKNNRNSVAMHGSKMLFYNNAILQKKKDMRVRNKLRYNISARKKRERTNEFSTVGWVMANLCCKLIQLQRYDWVQITTPEVK